MVSRVSLASPRSARSQEFANSVWRVARSLSETQIGLLRGVLQRNDEPFHLAALRGLGSALICASVRPASAALSVGHEAPSLVAASSLC